VEATEMSDGKLVRDLIPDQIREGGRNADVRYLTGEALVGALGEKLVEEAHEAAEVVGERERLLEELADVREVVAALMDARGITEQELTRAAAAKVQQRGGFRSGAWLFSPVPAMIRKYTSADVETQRVKWIPSRWKNAFAGHEAAYKALIEHSDEAGGIARSFIHARASGDPVELFLMTMAWGFRPRDYGVTRTERVLQQDGAEEKIAAIVDATRRDGAAAGWSALLNTHRISGLEMSFGTKLLYFAGYTTEHRPRPLVLDKRVREALQTAAPGTVPAKGKVLKADYLRYLDLAEEWAAEPTWAQEPDAVEYALFDQ
jgi:predicted house-cleaning noncanonical NTP pyrophosphatase (MazG superfamily)